MSIFRFLRYKYLLSSRRKHYASLAVSLALTHASFSAVKYRSLGNGMADISLELEGDQHFKLDFHPFTEKKNYTLHGTWKLENNTYELKFHRADPDLNTLFYHNTGFQRQTEITDSKTIRFPRYSGGLVIWGIYCPQL